MQYNVIQNVYNKKETKLSHWGIGLNGNRPGPRMRVRIFGPAGLHADPPPDGRWLCRKSKSPHTPQDQKFLRRIKYNIEKEEGKKFLSFTLSLCVTNKFIKGRPITKREKRRRLGTEKWLVVPHTSAETGLGSIAKLFRFPLFWPSL